MEVRIFTDGACSENPGPGGWGAVFYKDTTQEIISGHEIETTNNRMELMAVVESLKKILREHEEGVVYKIFSDSAYVVNSINSKWVVKWRINGWKTTRGDEIKNKDLWIKYLKLIGKLINKDNDIIIQVIKIKGHSDNAFNDHVDEIAKAEVKLARREKG
mgnify:CR=1 FL=1